MSAPYYRNGRSLAEIFLVHHKGRILTNQLLCDPFSPPWSEKNNGEIIISIFRLFKQGITAIFISVTAISYPHLVQCYS